MLYRVGGGQKFPIFALYNMCTTPYNPLVLPAHLQLSLSNALQIPLGSKFLTDLSTFKRLHFGMLYVPHHLRSLRSSFFSISFSSRTISSQFHKQLKTHLFLHSYSLLSLSFLYRTDVPLGTLIWPVCHSLFIPYPSSSIPSF